MGDGGEVQNRNNDGAGNEDPTRETQQQVNIVIHEDGKKEEKLKIGNASQTTMRYPARQLNSSMDSKWRWRGHGETQTLVRG